MAELLHQGRLALLGSHCRRRAAGQCLPQPSNAIVELALAFRHARQLLWQAATAGSEQAAEPQGPQDLPLGVRFGAVNDHPFAGRKPPFRSILASPQYVAEGVNIKESAGFAGTFGTRA